MYILLIKTISLIISFYCKNCIFNYIYIAVKTISLIIYFAVKSVSLNIYFIVKTVSLIILFCCKNYIYNHIYFAVRTISIIICLLYKTLSVFTAIAVEKMYFSLQQLLCLLDLAYTAVLCLSSSFLTSTIVFFSNLPSLTY